MMTFAKHSIALELQKTLQTGFYKTLNMNWKTLDDITTIYDQPIRLCLDLLSLYQNRTKEPSMHQQLDQMQKKYQRFNHKVLTSIDEEDILPLIQYIQNITPSINV